MSPHRAREAEIGEILARVGVRVKPLEWQPVEGLPCTRERAPALGGEYEIVRLDGDAFPPSVCFRVGVLSFVFILEDDPMGGKRPRQFYSLADAKAAAQSDYERRILSALSVKEPANAD